jgi:hypothetical protein
MRARRNDLRPVHWAAAGALVGFSQPYILFYIWLFDIWHAYWLAWRLVFCRPSLYLPLSAWFVSFWTTLHQLGFFFAILHIANPPSRWIEPGERCFLPSGNGRDHNGKPEGRDAHYKSDCEAGAPQNSRAPNTFDAQIGKDRRPQQPQEHNVENERCPLCIGDLPRLTDFGQEGPLGAGLGCAAFWPSLAVSAAPRGRFLRLDRKGVRQCQEPNESANGGCRRGENLPALKARKRTALSETSNAHGVTASLRRVPYQCPCQRFHA